MLSGALNYVRKIFVLTHVLNISLCRSKVGALSYVLMMSAVSKVLFTSGAFIVNVGIPYDFITNIVIAKVCG